jgi:murein DD-endopeptidase MepM/ murein hydrolase activator NlpD
MARLPFAENTITGVYGSMSDFRRKNGMQAHSGTDFAPAGSNKKKTLIPFVAKGKVTLIQWSNILGWVVEHTAWDVKKKKAAYIGYSHLACAKHGVNCKGGHEASIAFPSLKVGDEIEEGATVLEMGNTGSASSAKHLHLTISWKHKGVFGMTADKFDFVEWVKTQVVPAVKGAVKKTAAKPKAEAAKKTCPTCGQDVN